MSGLLVAVVVVSGMGCRSPSRRLSDEPEVPPSELAAMPDEDEPTGPSDQVAIPMPEYPAPERGKLVGVSAGPHSLDGAWPVRAGICADPPLLIVEASERGMGTVILLSLPPEGERITAYPVETAESGLPSPPGSRVGVQLLRDGVWQFRATGGEVEVSSFAHQVSARFAVTLREVVSEATVQFAGALQVEPLVPLPEGYCGMAAQHADSVTVPGGAGMPRQ